MRQHAPAAARAGEIADGVEDLAQVHLGLAPAPGRLGEKGPDPLPFPIGQIGRIAPPIKGLLALTMLFGPHPLHVDPTRTQSDPCRPMRHSQTGTKVLVTVDISTPGSL